MKENNYSLDKIDRRILAELHRDGRLTVTQLAEKVGLSSSPCWTRLKRLENLKVIDSYTANINPKAIGINELFFLKLPWNVMMMKFWNSLVMP